MTSELTYNSHAEPLSESFTLPGASEFSLTYERDASGRITSRSEVTPTGQTDWTYEYDAAGRLAQAKKDGDPYATYTYDANGNRTSSTYGTTQSQQVQATFDSRDRMRTQGPLTFTYNKNGELTSRENSDTARSASFSYDALGNLKRAVTEEGNVVTYKLDAAANRATRSVDGELTARYTYAPGIQGPVAEFSASGDLVATYTYATRSNVPDYMVKDGRTYRLIGDQLGSVRLVVDADSGEVAQEIEYDPFGRILRDTNQGFQPFGFAGGLYDSATGLTHFGAREYDAKQGRWTASDPISFAGGDSNLYGYVVGDPVNLVDPSGLLIPFIIGAAVIGGGLISGGLHAYEQSQTCRDGFLDVFRAFGTGAVGGSIGAGVSIAVGYQTAQPWLAGAAGGAVGGSVTRFLDGEGFDPVSTGTETALGAGGGVIGNWADPIKAGTYKPKLTTTNGSLSKSRLGNNSKRIIRQEAASSAASSGSQALMECGC